MAQAWREGTFITFSATDEIARGARRQNDIMSWSLPASYLGEIASFKNGGSGAVKEWNMHPTWLAACGLPTSLLFQKVKTCSCFASYFSVGLKCNGTERKIMKWTHSDFAAIPKADIYCNVFTPNIQRATVFHDGHRVPNKEGAPHLDVDWCPFARTKTRGVPQLVCRKVSWCFFWDIMDLFFSLSLTGLYRTVSEFAPVFLLRHLRVLFFWTPLGLIMLCEWDEASKRA